MPATQSVVSEEMMMKKGRKLGAVLMGFCFCIVGMFLLMSLTASAKSKILHEGYCGDYQNTEDDDFDHFNSENVKFTLYKDGTMVISGEGKMENYNDYDDCCTKYRIEDQMPWYQYRDKIKKVILEDGITGVGDHNFWGCKNLESIQWSKNLQSVGDLAFRGCSSLKEVTLPASVKEWKVCVFRECVGLKKVTIEDGVQFGEPGDNYYGRAMFLECSSLETVILPDDLEVIPASFVKGCPKIKEFNFPSKPVSLGSYPASLCPEKLVLPETIKYLMPGAFFDCKNLEELILPEGLQSIDESVIGGCENLKSLVIPDSVTKFEMYAFENSSIETVQLPKGMKVIPENMFAGCKNLKEIKIPNSVKKIENKAFLGCSSLKKVVLPKNLKEIGVEAFSGCTNLEKVVWKPTKNGYCEFYKYCFKDCKKLKQFTIPEKTTLLGRMFTGCSDVKVKILCSSEKLMDYFFLDHSFPKEATLLVPKGKLKEFLEVISKFETDTYKIRVREMKK